MRRHIILWLCCLAIAGCKSPFQDSAIRRGIEKINAPLSEGETKFFKNHISRRIDSFPSKIEDWSLIETSTKRTTGATERATDIIFGFSITAAYKNSANATAMVHIFINPIALGYNELDQGGFKFSDSHKPSRFLIDGPDGYLICDPTYSISTYPRLREFSYQGELGYKFVFGFTGREWKVKKYRGSSTFIDQDWLDLNISPSTWRNQIVGEYWVISAPTAEAATTLALAIWQRAQPHA